MCIGAEKSAIESKCGVSTGKAETDNFNLNRNMSAIQVKIKSTLIQHVPPYVLPWMLPVVLRLINCCLPGITFRYIALKMRIMLEKVFMFHYTIFKGYPLRHAEDSRG